VLRIARREQNILCASIQALLLAFGMRGSARRWNTGRCLAYRAQDRSLNPGQSAGATAGTCQGRRLSITRLPIGKSREAREARHR
jgi:hypothetical protein